MAEDPSYYEQRCECCGRGGARLRKVWYPESMLVALCHKCLGLTQSGNDPPYFVPYPDGGLIPPELLGKKYPR